MEAEFAPVSTDCRFKEILTVRSSLCWTIVNRMHQIHVQMIKILFPAFFLMVSSCGMITAKEIHGRQLLRPLMVQTAPPPLSYHGSAAGFDYFSTLFCKYKVPQTEEIMLEQYRRPFLSWRGGGEKQKPGPSINKQGKWTVMLFPAAAPLPFP